MWTQCYWEDVRSPIMFVTLEACRNDICPKQGPVHISVEAKAVNKLK
jgi:hypothetical protein